ncbi:MAG TPA: ribonuclease III [Microthrixaceae bacterium]|nr:ribonuclease III [Microthrixaceae bacterium]
MPSTTSSPGSEDDPVTPREHLCRRIDYQFTDPDRLDLALRHRSWCAENGSVASNERLEFLGDSVLGLVITDHLYLSAPDRSEGVLARNRSELVSAVALAAVARSVDLGAALLLGKGEESTGGRDKTSILSDAMEAVIGAVYLDGGIGEAGRVILHILSQRIEEVLEGSLASDHKSRLQEFAAHEFGELPQYSLSDDGPEHEKKFVAKVELQSEEWGTGAGRTKKEAEQAAARHAYLKLQEQGLPDIASAEIDDRPGGEDVSTAKPSNEAETTPVRSKVSTNTQTGTTRTTPEDGNA